MTTPAFIVEGRAEQKIIQRLCPSAKVMILECNGDHVAISAIAKKVAALTRICGNRHYPIVIQFDREKRVATATNIAAELLSALEYIGLSPDQYRVGIADRDMEAWILYSINQQGEFEANCVSATENEFEGFSGEFVLRERLQKQNIGYHKTTSGVELFTKIIAKDLAEKSESFRNFVQALDFDCFWLN